VILFNPVCRNANISEELHFVSDVYIEEIPASNGLDLLARWVEKNKWHWY
jgi:hypothetical protein